jgi:cleavage and polyadenylation specificity factor subunit 3
LGSALPYFLEKTPFQGRVFMTHPTKAVYKMLVSDYVRVSSSASEEQLFTEQDLENSMEKIEVLHYHQRVTVNGITFEALNAGHVLGAAQFMIEVCTFCSCDNVFVLLVV